MYIYVLLTFSSLSNAYLIHYQIRINLILFLSHHCINLVKYCDKPVYQFKAVLNRIFCLKCLSYIKMDSWMGIWMVLLILPYKAGCVGVNYFFYNVRANFICIKLFLVYIRHWKYDVGNCISESDLFYPVPCLVNSPVTQVWYKFCLLDYLVMWRLYLVTWSCDPTTFWRNACGWCLSSGLNYLMEDFWW